MSVPPVPLLSPQARIVEVTTGGEPPLPDVGASGETVPCDAEGLLVPGRLDEGVCVIGGELEA